MDWNVGPALSIAYALNSVKFDPATAGRCNDLGECSLARGQGNWNIEASICFFLFISLHQELLIDFLGNNQKMTIVGWASDGFPVYARYGYSEANNSKRINSMTPSYRLKSEPDVNRPSTLTALIGGPGQGTTNPNTPIPMGFYARL